MAKPWARYEIGFINHDKFLALTANAIALWLEGKDYCDSRHTDGLLPLASVKVFRFYGKKSVELLTASCGEKPGTGAPYFPLWEEHPIGFKMHNYLKHNECRDKVIARLVKSDEEKQRKRDNQQAYREREAERRQSERRVTEALPVTLPDDSITARSQTVTLPDKQKPDPETRNHNKQEQERVTARSNRPIYVGQRVKIFEWLFDDLRGLLGPYADAFELDLWFQALNQRCLLENIIPPERDNGAWVKAETLKEAQRRGLPLQLVTAEIAPTGSKRVAGLATGGDAFLRRVRS